MTDYSFVYAEPDFGFITDAFTGIDLGIGHRTIAVIIVLLTAIGITRNTRHIRMILLPLTLGYRIIGLDPGIVMLVGSALIWGVTLLSTNLIGNLLTSVTTTVGEKITSSARTSREKYGSLGLLPGFRAMYPKTMEDISITKAAQKIAAKQIRASRIEEAVNREKAKAGFTEKKRPSRLVRLLRSKGPTTTEPLSEWELRERRKIQY